MKGQRVKHLFLSLCFSLILITSILPFGGYSGALSSTPPTKDKPWPYSIQSKDNPIRQACLSGASVESNFLSTFDVHAIHIDTVYNKYGQHDPNGVMYV